MFFKGVVVGFDFYVGGIIFVKDIVFLYSQDLFVVVQDDVGISIIVCLQEYIIGGFDCCLYFKFYGVFFVFVFWGNEFQGGVEILIVDGVYGQ